MVRNGFWNQMLQKGGETFYALADQGGAVGSKQGVEEYDTTPHLGCLHGLRGAFLLHFENLKNVVFRKSVRIFSKESVRQTSSAISSRDRALRLKLGWWIALIKA